MNLDSTELTIEVLQSLFGPPPLYLDWGGFLSFLVLVATFLLLAVYTYYTYQLAKEAQLSREAGFRPFLHLEGLDTRVAHISNFGCGVAIDVGIEEYAIDGNSCSFDKITLVPFATANNAVAKALPFRFGRSGSKAVSSRKLILTCRDIAGNRYNFEYRIFINVVEFVRSWKV